MNRRKTMPIVAAAALMTLPVTIRNQLVTGDATWVATSGGSNFYSGNNAEARGGIVKFSA